MTGMELKPSGPEPQHDCPEQDKWDEEKGFWLKLSAGTWFLVCDDSYYTTPGILFCPWCGVRLTGAPVVRTIKPD